MVTRIEKENYIMDVDVEKTQEYYKDIELCDCDNCCNFYEAINNRFSKLKDFFSEFGIDIARPDEIGSYVDASKQCVNYYFVAYTVTGTLINQDKYEIDIFDDGLFLNIVIDEGYVPNTQTEKYFVITVYNIVLPWVLGKPLEPLMIEKKEKGGFIKKILKF